MGMKKWGKYVCQAIALAIFFAISSVSSLEAFADSGLKKEFNERINTGKDTGYSEAYIIDENDPHYDWYMGTFSVNGFSNIEKNEEDGIPVFLKLDESNISISFTLNEDIDKLNGNKKLSVKNDKNGYDSLLETGKGLGRGAFILRYTDCDGVTHESEVRKNFLTDFTVGEEKVVVENLAEGDYEVALDYEIKSKGFFPKYTDYRVSFNFKVRSGLTYLHVLDGETGKISKLGEPFVNGFKLDFSNAKSLSVKMSRKTVESDGVFFKYEEEIEIEPDAETTYSEEGVYTVVVNNPYKNSTTVKCIVVGKEPIYKALCKKTIDDVNECLGHGALLNDDGTFDEIDYGVYYDVSDKAITKDGYELEYSVQAWEYNNKFFIEQDDVRALQAASYESGIDIDDLFAESTQNVFDEAFELMRFNPATFTKGETGPVSFLFGKIIYNNVSDADITENNPQKVNVGLIHVSSSGFRNAPRNKVEIAYIVPSGVAFKEFTKGKNGFDLIYRSDSPEVDMTENTMIVPFVIRCVGDLPVEKSPGYRDITGLMLDIPHYLKTTEFEPEFSRDLGFAGLECDNEWAAAY